MDNVTETAGVWLVTDWRSTKGYGFTIWTPNAGSRIRTWRVISDRAGFLSYDAAHAAGLAECHAQGWTITHDDRG